MRFCFYIFSLLISAVFLIPTSACAQDHSHRIGLLLPDASHQAEVLLAQEIIENANADLPSGAQPFELVVRTVDGPWGMGSKQAVSLVYEDNVLLYLGALGGQNAHLAEQVAAKAHLVYIETHATEPTLSQAYVPWFLRTVPNDLQQAAFLLESMGSEGKILILSREDSDTHHACRSLLRTIAREKGTTPLVVKASASPGNVNGTNPPKTVATSPGKMIPDPHVEEIMTALREQDIQHLVFTYWTPGLLPLSQQISKEFPTTRQYGNLHFASGLKEAHGSSAMPQNLILSSPYSYQDFLAAALTLSLEAIRTYGSEREILKDKIPHMECMEGPTGPVAFDELGNRKF